MLNITDLSLASLLAVAATVGVCGTASGSETFRIAEDQAFTIVPNTQTAVVVRAQPDAACDLHAEGIADASGSLKLYANEQGYVRVHVTAKDQSVEVSRLQLDCTAAGAVMTYPIQLRVAFAPTDAMPAPQTEVPTPAGSKILPPLTAEDARWLSDQDLRRLGYPARPDPTTSADRYAKWLARLSEPLILIPVHSPISSDVYHQTVNVEASSHNNNWSGYIAQGGNHSYMMVLGEWAVPELRAADPNNSTYSSLWIGLDGYNLTDLVQAGTEQDVLKTATGLYIAHYYAWTEILPNQPTSDPVPNSVLSIDGGDEIETVVWVGTANGTPNPYGTYAFFYFYDWTQHKAYGVSMSLGSMHFNGQDAEWIMERPELGGGPEAKGGSFALLSDYGSAAIADAYALKSSDVWESAQAASNAQLWLYNNDYDGQDNNLLSSAELDGVDYILFYWNDFH
jgi:hypothetical protein